MEVGLLRPIPTSVTELLSGFAEITQLPLSHSIKHYLISKLKSGKHSVTL